ncbi:ribonuclease H-like YkuK family protein [Patescibacteria group bacterium]
MQNKDIFHSPTNGEIKLSDLAKEVSDFMSQSSKDKYQLVVGTDSAGTQESDSDFVTAVIVYRIGHGGRYFWRRTNGGKIFHTLRDRIYNEVVLSLKTAQDMLAQFKTILKSDNESNYDLQIHIDVGKNGPTREMIKEVVGMVRGNGFKAKIKPYAYGASNIADRYI